MHVLAHASGRLALRALAVTAAAALLLTTALANVASAHGSTTDPMSRNYGCWKRWHIDRKNFQAPEMATEDPMCSQAWKANPSTMWNWNNLFREGVKGAHQAAIPDGQLCSGGQYWGKNPGDRYHTLDKPGPWKTTALNNNFRLTVHDQALHGADYYKVYVTKQGYDAVTQPLKWSDLELVKETGRIRPAVGAKEAESYLNGVSVGIDVSAPGRSGRHIVYTIWQASHSDQSYYLCSDVSFPGGSGGSGNSGTPAATRTPAPPASPTQSPTPSVPDPTVTPPVEPSAPPPGESSGCTAKYTVLSQWPGGFQGNVTVTAGSTALMGWTVNWTFADGQKANNTWSSAVTTNGANVTARNVHYNGNLAAGQSATFGFVGTWNGANGAPTATCTAA